MPIQDQEGGEAPVDPEELKQAEQTLLDAGLTEEDLDELSDSEIIDLAEEYRSGKNKEPEEEVPKRQTG